MTQNNPMTDPRELKALMDDINPRIKFAQYHDRHTFSPQYLIDDDTYTAIMQLLSFAIRAALTEPREWREDELHEILKKANVMHYKRAIRALAASGVIKLAPEPAAKAGGEG